MHASDAIIEIPPRFRVVGPSCSVMPADGVVIVLRDGSAFGDGRHETTQLCLQAVAAFAPRTRQDWRMLDFGSGTGILSIAAAKLGARALGVEIDMDALASARENAALSSVEGRVDFAAALPPEASTATFDVVVANILRGVLVDVARELVACLAPTATLVLSGLVSTDVPEVSARYASLLGGQRPEIYQRGEWRALAWRRR